jgi:hypothetical protein
LPLGYTGRNPWSSQVATRKQIEANKRNAKQSTGPRTADGKARVASNALKHGLSARQIVLVNERAQDFDAFRLGLLSDLNPVGEYEEALTENIIAGQWRLRRVPALEAAVFETGMGEISEDAPAAITYALRKFERPFVNLWRYESMLSRSVSRAYHDLERLQAKRAGEPVAAPAVMDVDVNLRHGAANPEPISLSSDPVAAKIEPDPTSAEDNKARVSFLVTNAQKAQLRDLGHSDHDIALMKPAHVHRILGLK